MRNRPSIHRHPAHPSLSLPQVLTLLLLLLAGSAMRSQPLPDPVEEAPPAPPALAAVPEVFALRGRVLDQNGQPASGVTVQVPDSGNRAVSDAMGCFALPSAVRRGDPVEISGPGYVRRRVPAATVWAGHDDETGEAQLRIIRLTELFEVGPGGGVSRGDVTFEVPPGAVDRPTVLSAALLPRSEIWAARQGLHPDPLGAVHFEPAGLTFARPVRVRLPLPPGADPPGEPSVTVFDPESQTYEPAEGASAAVEGGELVLTLRHFSRYLIGDPGRGIERRLVDRSTDLNGDGRLSAEDADLVVVLQGGTHEVTWSTATTLASTVFASTGRSTETTGEETVSATAGVSFGGVGASVGTTVSRETAEQVLEKLGFSATSERSTRLTSGPVQAAEYERRCLYLLRIYNFWDVTLWERLELSQGARDRFAVPDDRDWHYYTHEGDSIMLSDRTLPAGRYAARWEGGRRVIYRQTDRFVVREPDGGTTSYACSTELPVAPRDLWRGGDELGEARFFPSGAGFVSVEYGGWGVLPTTVPKSYGPIECGRPGIELEVTLRSGSELASERERSESVRERSASSASVTLEAPLPGGLGVSGGASWEQAAGRARGFSTAYGNTLLRQQETTVTYGILSAHDYHFSDHEVYPLHLLHTVRSWEPVERSEVPRELTGLPATGWRWFGDRAFARLGDDAYVMRTAGGGWFASGPPVTTTREVGLYMVRVAERFCHPLRDETVPMPREEAEPPAVPTPSGRDVETPSGHETEEEAPGEQGALPPEGSRAVVTGTVVDGEPATLTAVGPDGSRLTGVVVDIGGREHTTDEDGRVVFTPPSGIERLTVTLTDASGTPSTATAEVVPRPQDFEPSRPPGLDDVPPFPTPGSEITVGEGPFDGGGGTTATLDGEEVSVLAASPIEVVVATDPATPLGEHDLVVSTDAGPSPPATLTFLALRLEATATDLVRGQRSTARLVVEGTAKKLCVRVVNETPQVISLKGGETVHVVTGGGEPNGAELRFTAVGPGAFSIQAEVLGEGGKGCRGH